MSSLGAPERLSSVQGGRGSHIVVIRGAHYFVKMHPEVAGYSDRNACTGSTRTARLAGNVALTAAVQPIATNAPRYGSGLPFNRLEGLQGSMGIPLPASTQWDIVQDVAVGLDLVFEELIRQAADGDVLYNDDTGMKVVSLMNEPDRKSTRLNSSH